MLLMDASGRTGRPDVDRRVGVGCLDVDGPRPVLSWEGRLLSKPATSGELWDVWTGVVLELMQTLLAGGVSGTTASRKNA